MRFASDFNMSDYDHVQKGSLKLKKSALSAEPSTKKYGVTAYTAAMRSPYSNILALRFGLKL